MDKKEGHGTIVIKKGKKHGHGGAHGGAWKVAYADFVTAMMAFFIVMWIIGQSEEAKQQIADYFQNPTAGIMTGNGPSVIPGETIKAINADLIEQINKAQQERQEFSKMGEELIEKLRANPDFSAVLDNVIIEFVEEGMRIELVETADNIFFEIGTSTLNQRAREILKTIGVELAKVPNEIIIEGHTDSRPYPNARYGYSNYELSADRANSARRALLEGGMREDQINQVRGWADKHLRNPADPLDTVNRRISIIIKYSE